MHRSERFRTSGALGRYLGAARNYGFGAIRVQIGRHVRIVSSHHYVAREIIYDREFCISLVARWYRRTVGR